jgi:hypothetical protein
VDLLRHGARKRERGRRALEVVHRLFSAAAQALVGLGSGGDRRMPERIRSGAHVERDQERDHPFLADHHTPDQNRVALHSPVIGDPAIVRNRSRDFEVAGPRDASIGDILALQGLDGPDPDLAARRFRGSCCSRNSVTSRHTTPLGPPATQPPTRHRPSSAIVAQPVLSPRPLTYSQPIHTCAGHPSPRCRGSCPGKLGRAVSLRGPIPPECKPART